MEQNEMFEDNGFDNFKDQGKYKSVTLRRENRADGMAKIAVVLLLMGIAFGGMDMEWQKMVVCVTPIGYSVKWSDAIFGAFYVCAGVIASIAFIIKRTKLVKGVFAFLVMFPISLVLAAFLTFIFFYVLFYPLLQLAWSSM